MDGGRHEIHDWRYVADAEILHNARRICRQKHIPHKPQRQRSAGENMGTADKPNDEHADGIHRHVHGGFHCAGKVFAEREARDVGGNGTFRGGRVCGWRDGRQIERIHAYDLSSEESGDQAVFAVPTGGKQPAFVAVQGRTARDEGQRTEGNRGGDHQVCAWSVHIQRCI